MTTDAPTDPPHRLLRHAFPLAGKGQGKVGNEIPLTGKGCRSLWGGFRLTGKECRSLWDVFPLTVSAFLLRFHVALPFLLTLSPVMIAGQVA